MKVQNNVEATFEFVAGKHKPNVVQLSDDIAACYSRILNNMIKLMKTICEHFDRCKRHDVYSKNCTKLQKTITQLHENPAMKLDHNYAKTNSKWLVHVILYIFYVINMKVKKMPPNIKNCACLKNKAPGTRKGNNNNALGIGLFKNTGI